MAILLLTHYSHYRNWKMSFFTVVCSRYHSGSMARPFSSFTASTTACRAVGSTAKFSSYSNTGNKNYLRRLLCTPSRQHSWQFAITFVVSQTGAFPWSASSAPSERSSESSSVLRWRRRGRVRLWRRSGSGGVWFWRECLGTGMDTQWNSTAPFKVTCVWLKRSTLISCHWMALCVKSMEVKVVSWAVGVSFVIGNLN